MDNLPYKLLRLSYLTCIYYLSLFYYIYIRIFLAILQSDLILAMHEELQVLIHPIKNINIHFNKTIQYFNISKLFIIVINVFE